MSDRDALVEMVERAALLMQTLIDGGTREPGRWEGSDGDIAALVAAWRTRR
jgi:hypothetical protein